VAVVAAKDGSGASTGHGRQTAVRKGGIRGCYFPSGATLATTRSDMAPMLMPRWRPVEGLIVGVVTAD
jgi:hypothetical protein